MDPSRSISRLPAKVEAELRPIFRAVSELKAKESAAVQAAVGSDPLAGLDLLTSFRVIQLNAPDATEARAGHVELARAHLLARRAPLTAETIAHILTAYSKIDQRCQVWPELEEAFAILTARFFNRSLVKEQPELSPLQPLPFLPAAGGEYLDLASGVLSLEYLSAPFKRSGVQLTMVDNSARVLRAIRLAAEQVELSSRVATCSADVCDVPDLFSPKSFDVVRFRQPNACFSDRGRSPEELNLEKLLGLVKPGGLFVVSYYAGDRVQSLRDLGEVARYLNELFFDRVCALADSHLKGWTVRVGSWSVQDTFAENVSGDVRSSSTGPRPETLAAFQRPRDDLAEVI